MNKNFFKVLSLSALVLTSASVFTSCNEDDEYEEITPEKDVEKRVFILNEGAWQANNSTLDIYYPNGESSYQSKVFATVNGQGIGDTGQDIIYYGDRIYLVVSGSNYLAKLDLNGKIVEQHTFTDEEGTPRHIVAKDGFVYVTSYAGTVVKFDTTSIVSSVKSVEVGNNPENLAVKDNLLIVCNSQKNNESDKRISIIDLSTFTLKQNIETEFGNFQDVVVAGDSVYVTYYTPSYSIELLNLDVKSFNVTPTGSASRIAYFDNKLYGANAATVYDENWNPTVNTSFFVRDIKTGKDSEFLDLTSVPELATATVYLFEVNPDNGDVYVGTTDYQSNGTIYRFDKNGKFVTKFETSGVNPNTAVFVY